MLMTFHGGITDFSQISDTPCLCVGQPARISSRYKPRQILPRAAESRQSNHQNPGAEFQLDIIKLWPRKLIQTNRNELMELNIIARQNI